VQKFFLHFNECRNGVAMPRSKVLSVILCTLVCCTAVQAQSFRSRGFIPPLFTLPDASEVLRFSSPVQPVFPLPEYPADALERGEEGVVEVSMYVTSEGEVVFAEIAVSSGHRHFDNAALESALRAKFPIGYATVKGMPRDFRIAVPYYFLLASDPELYWHSRLELVRIQQEYEVVMKKFEDVVMSRTISSKKRFKQIQQELEETVSNAKRVHRLLAEKKERAIIRLKERLDASRSDEAPIAIIDDEAWRVTGATRAHTIVGGDANSGNAVINLQECEWEDTDRLEHELDLKRAYM